MILRNVAAVILAILVGGAVNFGLIQLGYQIVPPPEGFDPNDLATFKLLQARHLVLPFIAHALGTLVGATIAHVVAGTNKTVFGMLIGAWFLLGGIAMVVMIGGPAWFVVLDLGVAYIPMAGSAV